jgi:uncharacterized membrane protein
MLGTQMQISSFILLSVVLWGIGWLHHIGQRIWSDPQIVTNKWIALVCGMPQAKGILSTTGTTYQLTGFLVALYGIFLSPFDDRWYAPIIVLSISYLLSLMLTGYLYKTRRYTQEQKPPP